MTNPKFPHQPRKRFGQNFLKDPSTIDKIITSLQLKPNDTVIEIGPGLGALTAPLLDHLNHLTLIEIDRDLSTKLKIAFLNSDKLTIHNQDALHFDFQAFHQQLPTSSKIRLIGNLPYNITTPLLFHLFHFTPIIQDMHFMLQKEVVSRLTAKPNHKAYGRLSVMAQYYCQADDLFDVPPESFYPKPSVNSAVVRLIPHVNSPIRATNLDNFQNLVRDAFSQRRKTLRNSLKSYLSPTDFEPLGIDSTLRPEALSLQDFVKISNFISKKQENI